MLNLADPVKRSKHVCVWSVNADARICDISSGHTQQQKQQKITIYLTLASSRWLFYTVYNKPPSLTALLRGECVQHSSLFIKSIAYLLIDYQEKCT